MQTEEQTRRRLTIPVLRNLQTFRIPFLGSIINVKYQPEVGIHMEKLMIDKINRGSLGKTREANKTLEHVTYHYIIFIVIG